MYISKENKKSHISYTYKVEEVTKGSWGKGEVGGRGRRDERRTGTLEMKKVPT